MSNLQRERVWWRSVASSGQKSAAKLELFHRRKINSFWVNFEIAKFLAKKCGRHHTYWCFLWISRWIRGFLKISRQSAHKLCVISANFKRYFHFFIEKLFPRDGQIRVLVAPSETWVAGTFLLCFKVLMPLIHVPNRWLKYLPWSFRNIFYEIIIRTWDAGTATDFLTRVRP